jgi:hypothetical protein
MGLSKPQTANGTRPGVAGVFDVEPLIEQILWVQTRNHPAYLSHREKRPRKAIGHENVTSQG